MKGGVGAPIREEQRAHGPRHAEGIEELPGGLFCGIAENVYRDGQILYSSLEEVTLPSTLKRIRSNSDEYSTLGAFYTVEGTFRYARNLKKINWPTDCQIEEFES